MARSAATTESKREIKSPGIRGGQWYRTGSGKIRYGSPPRGREAVVQIQTPRGPVFGHARVTASGVHIAPSSRRVARAAVTGQVAPLSMRQVRNLLALKQGDEPSWIAPLHQFTDSVRKAIAQQVHVSDDPPLRVTNDGTTPEELVADARRAWPILRAACQAVARSVGGHVWAGPADAFAIKSIASIRSKIARKREALPDATESELVAHAIGDAVRCTIAVDSPEQLTRAIRHFRRAATNSGWAVSVENKYTGPSPSGYYGVHYTVVMQTPEGRHVTGEVQFHLRPMVEVKEAMHRIYDRVRELGATETVKDIAQVLLLSAAALAPYSRWFAG